MAGLAQAGGSGVEEGEVQVQHVGHGAAEVDSFHWESLPGHARAVEWGSSGNPTRGARGQDSRPSSTTVTALLNG